jgi:hypothetical protein
VNIAIRKKVRDLLPKITTVALSAIFITTLSSILRATLGKTGGFGAIMMIYVAIEVILIVTRNRIKLPHHPGLYMLAYIFIDGLGFGLGSLAYLAAVMSAWGQELATRRKGEDTQAPIR